MRHAHYLKQNENTEIPRYIICFDTETTQVKISKDKVLHQLRLGQACFTQRTRGNKWTTPEWLLFTSQDEFWDWVVKHTLPGSKVNVFCHNSNFDYPIVDVFHQLPTRGFRLRSAVIEGPPTILTFRRKWREKIKRGGVWVEQTDGDKPYKTSTIRCLDTLNWWRLPLKKIGEIVGLEKTECDTEHASDADLATYCKNDCEIVRRAVVEWLTTIQEKDLGGFAPTLAGQSMRMFRHKYMDHSILIHDDERALKLERLTYYGGRNEVMHRGKWSKQTFLLDINSMYPFVMKKYCYPTKLLKYTESCSVYGLIELIREYAVCATVDIDTDEPVYPVRGKAKLVFPVGQFRSHLTTPELAYALQHGHVRDVKALACYECAPIFERFVRCTYEEREAEIEAGHTTRAYNLKILMNSLYGKTGQRGFKFEGTEWIEDLEARTWDEIIRETGQVIHHRQMGGLVQHSSLEGEAPDSFPAIAAHVTAYARMLLWDLIQRAGERQVLYVDTDSLLCTELGMRRLKTLIDPKTLGKLKLEGAFNSVEIHTCKDYRMGNKRKTKGVKKSAVRVGHNQYRQDRWTNLLGMIRHGDLDKVFTERYSKTLSRTYDKGYVLPSGWVRPWELPREGSMLA